MTPAIREWMALTEDPTEFQWFDISEAVKTFSEKTQVPLDRPPPFNRCMVVARLHRNNIPHDVAMVVAGDDPHEGICLTAWIGITGTRPRAVPGLLYTIDDDGQVLYGPLDEDQPSQQDVESLLGFLAHFYRTLNTTTVAYSPVPKPGFITQKRLAKGKKPLYEWKTVILEPRPAAQSDPKGTHASPRLHDRRGHIRRLPSGKEVWVKPCKVGTAELGTIWHDYVSKPSLNTQQLTVH